MINNNINKINISRKRIKTNNSLTKKIKFSVIENLFNMLRSLKNLERKFKINEKKRFNDY